MDGNIKDTPPVIFVPQPADRRRLEALAAEIAGPSSGKSMARKKRRPGRIRKMGTGATRPTKFAAADSHRGTATSTPASAKAPAKRSI